MEDKEIIIDGKKEKVNILFECNHIDVLQAYEMMKNGIEITPENAPICNFKIKIISNTKSPYGFYTIFQKDPKKEKWEYMGIGHSGASSLITALLKAHEMGKNKENFAKDINVPSKEQIIIDSVDVSGCTFHYQNKEGKHKCFKCDVVTICDEDCSYGAIYLKEQLARKTQECEELKDSVDKIKNYVKNQMFDVDCKNWFDRFIYTFEYWKKSICEANDRYRKALEEIERELKEDIYCESQECGCDDYEECLRCTKNIILDIISKAKDGKNDR